MEKMKAIKSQKSDQIRSLQQFNASKDAKIEKLRNDLEKVQTWAGYLTVHPLTNKDVLT